MPKLSLSLLLRPNKDRRHGSATPNTKSSQAAADDQLYQVPPPQQNNNLGSRHPHPESTLGFAGDEPLPSSSPAQSSSPQNVTIKTHTETSAICSAESSPQFPVLVSIRAPPLQDSEGEGRTPIDLVTVLDVSSSMAGLKLDLVKRAVKFVIENLGASDRLSIVTFSTRARTVFPLRRMSVEGRESAIRAVDSLKSEDMTDIVAGLEIGARILEGRRERNPVASIMLLSDGMHNSGDQILVSNQLPASIRCSNMQQEIPIHTFGFGRDHDAKIMHAISDASGGTFSFIESFGMIQDAFALCIGGLLSVVAQEVRLTVRSASSGVKIAAIPSGRHVSQISDEGQQGVVDVGNMYAEEEKQFLVYLLVPQSSVSHIKTSLLDMLCVYKDLASNEFIQVQGERVEISRPEVCSPAEKTVCLEVDRQRNRLLVADVGISPLESDAIGEAQRLAETGNLEGAREILTQRRKTLLASPAAQAGDDLSHLFETELSEIMDKMESRHTYEKAGRAYALAGMSSHSWQRASARGNARGSFLAGGFGRGGAKGSKGGRFGAGSGGASSGAAVGAFETPAMVRMVWKSQKSNQQP